MQSMATRHPHTGAPKRLYSLIEWRALAEMASLPFSWPLLAQLPRGDGHPVLVPVSYTHLTLPTNREG